MAKKKVEAACWKERMDACQTLTELATLVTEIPQDERNEAEIVVAMNALLERTGKKSKAA